MKLYPMSFLEFLDAVGEGMLSEIIQKQDWRVIEQFSVKLKDLLKQYYYVGGMPEAVLAFSETHDWIEVRNIQNEILESYSRDFSKHSPQDIVPRISQLWNSIPAQLSKENRKFLYGVVRKGARAREYELALQWLFDSGLIYRVSRITAPRLPLKSYEDKVSFKIYSLDIGLLCAMSGLDSVTIVNGNSIFTEFKGALTEQYVLQQLVLKHQPYYWSKANAQQEVDFVLQLGEDIVPIEVKAEENLHAKSLRQFVSENESRVAYRVSMSNFREESWMTNLPLYAVNTI
jgi:predicted AAA+ superfamily ATPase